MDPIGPMHSIVSALVLHRKGCDSRDKKERSFAVPVVDAAQPTSGVVVVVLPGTVLISLFSASRTSKELQQPSI
jgi:hypothetical protein